MGLPSIVLTFKRLTLQSYESSLVVPSSVLSSSLSNQSPRTKYLKRLNGPKCHPQGLAKVHHELERSHAKSGGACTFLICSSDTWNSTSATRNFSWLDYEMRNAVDIRRFEMVSVAPEPVQQHSAHPESKEAVDLVGPRHSTRIPSGIVRNTRDAVDRC